MFGISFNASVKLFRRFGWLLAACLGAVLLVNLFVGVLLHGNPLEPLYDRKNVIAILSTAFVLAAAIFGLGRLLWLIESHQHKTWKQGVSMLVCNGILLFAFSSCDMETSSRVNVKSAVQGSISNLATGLKATYRNMETEKVKLLMNDEVLGHADIPLGEKFYIINEGVKGLQEKEGLVSVGCSLKITDEQGNVILNEPDLFAGKRPV